MKRRLEQPLITLNNVIHLLDLADPLVEWLWQPCFTDVKALFSFHATCRHLWRLYCERDLTLLESQWEAKVGHHRSYNLKGPAYAERHQYCLLRLLKQTTHLNAFIFASLKSINERLACEEEKETIWEFANPLENIGIIAKLSDLPKFMVESEEESVHERGRYILGVCQLWLRCRFGWDMAIADEESLEVTYSERFVENYLGCLKDNLCVCNAKYISLK